MTSRTETLGSNSSSTFTTFGIFSPSNACNSDRGNLNSPPPSWKINSLCHSCQQPGHLGRNCPNRTPPPKSRRWRQLLLGPPPSPPSAAPSPVVYCPCGAGICDVKVSRKRRSSGRKFYSCPLFPSANRCDFFKWCDELSSDDPTYDAPTCECGAGPCHVYQETDGPNAGRKFFVCPIMKGKGACDFKRLVGATDSHSNDGTTTPLSIFTNCHENRSANCDFVVKGDSPKQNDFQGQGACGFSRSVGATNYHSNEGTNASQSTLTDCHENSSTNFVDEEDSPKQKSFQGQGACGFRRFLDATDSHLDEGATFSQSTLTDSHENSSANSVSVVGGDFACQVQEIGSSVVDCLEHALRFGIISDPPRKDRIPLVDSEGGDNTSDEPLRNCYKRLRCGALKSDGFALNITSDGWDVPQSKPKGLTMVKALGASVLTPEPSRPQKRLFLGQISPDGSSLTGAGISSSFNLVCDPQDVNVSNAEVAAIVPYSQSSAEPDKQSLLLEGQSCLKQPSKTLQGTEVTESIEETFHEAAKQIQNKLLSVLELSDFRDHETMASDASSVFRALDGLLVDYQPFKQRVMEFVGTAASLAKEAKLSIGEDNSLQQNVDRYNCHKQHLESVSHVHAETAAALEDSTEHLESLRKEAARVMAMRRRIEEELLSCEAENVEILYRLEQVNEEKLKSQQSLEVAAMEMKEARKLCEKREAAEATFKAVKLKLQRYWQNSTLNSEN